MRPIDSLKEFFGRRDSSDGLEEGRAGQRVRDSDNAHGQAGSPAPTMHRAPTDTNPRRRLRSRKKRNRRQSFAAGAGIAPSRDGGAEQRAELEQRNSFYQQSRADGSNSSIASSALLDHRSVSLMSTLMVRDQESFNVRRQSATKPSGLFHRSTADSRSGLLTWPKYEDDNADDATDRTPLITTTGASNENVPSRYGIIDTGFMNSPLRRQQSMGSSRSPLTLQDNRSHLGVEYDVNNPPSVPGSPSLAPVRQSIFEDLITTHDFELSTSPERRRTIIGKQSSHSPTDDFEQEPNRPSFDTALSRDVFVPYDEGMSDVAEHTPAMEDGRTARRRHRQRPWPDFMFLEEWSKEARKTETLAKRAKKISEPVLVGGRLRAPHKAAWHLPEEDEDGPYRFTYFNETFDKTIHAHDLWSLPQDGQDFVSLFKPDAAILTDDESDHEAPAPGPSGSRPSVSQSEAAYDPRKLDVTPPGERARSADSARESSQPQPQPRKLLHEPRYGERPTFWLDVLSPTEEEMKVLSRVFQIHPLTAEDIMMQEAREKVELFSNYYFVNYRTFEQDPQSEDYLEPVNMYVVVFREGLLSFHFSMTPHPANVRRRIRQLQDYLVPDADWISYAIIDDITDVFDPLTKSIEQEVDDIDDAILRMHSSLASTSSIDISEKKSAAAQFDQFGGDMLRRVGETRKKVMGLYRLLSSKADVIKGFAKRCNPDWNVAPRSEVGLYLGDIQDHIVTMVGILSHCEQLLSRSHSNYLAQINLRMNERQEETADVLGRLTVLGTIVLPMNIVTGLWGMNVLVPGQDVENLNWFICITIGLLIFGFACFLIAKRVYKL